VPLDKISPTRSWPSSEELSVDFLALNQIEQTRHIAGCDFAQLSDALSQRRKAFLEF
jgi:hypothetical protein